MMSTSRGGRSGRAIVEEYNRRLAPGEAKLVLNAQADLSDEEARAGLAI